MRTGGHEKLQIRNEGAINIIRGEIQGPSKIIFRLLANFNDDLSLRTFAYIDFSLVNCILTYRLQVDIQ